MSRTGFLGLAVLNCNHPKTDKSNKVNNQNLSKITWIKHRDEGVIKMKSPQSLTLESIYNMDNHTLTHHLWTKPNEFTEKMSRD